jgi:hypothetical protein
MRNMELKNSGKKVNKMGVRVWEGSMNFKGFNYQGLFLVRGLLLS